MSFFKTKKGISLYYEDLNPQGKETVAFFNGVMASAASWTHQSSLFEKLGYRVLLHDFKGQMLSDKPQGPYTFHEHAAEAAELLDSLKTGKLHIVGTSYGGEIAMRFALNYPERVKSISIIDSVSELDDLLKLFIAQWTRMAQQKDGKAFFWGMTPTIYGNSFIKNNLDFLQERVKSMSAGTEDYFMGQEILYETFLNHVTMTEELPKIKCPTLVVCGQEDLLKPVKFSKIIADQIPNSEFAVIPDCGHATFLEKPDILNSMLLGFITKHSQKF